jgi:bone morphogenetic protein 2/4
VLATQFFTVQQVASTEEVRSSSKSSSSSNSESSYLIAETSSVQTLDPSSLDSSALDSSSLDSNSVDNSDNLSNNDNMKGEKPDPQTLVQIEKNLLSLFGFTKRPKVDRSKIVIPEAMKQLYAQIMGHELDSSYNVPKAGLHTKKANTIRSFTHEGKSILLFPL